ncbi:MFS transporter [Amycolatopsis vancoresmycina]|uniref:Methylenomycin A resistance protein n=1 Tax=Amycolatopsis vancoresmycina DSM 44592 TaxID=1292037 RepID=R1H472_9PSEU|nr:MFS transporter [Amycolatopsis vancoresmycina]EOD58440.1 methylenomycin A resistance protein [Amycolatopsis vancoresmycina DSM 44592]
MARLLIGLSLGYFLVMLDTTIVTVALPALSSSLPAQQWISNGYTLTFAVFLLPAGAWSDRFGARRVFFLGLGSFAALSGLSALSFSTSLLIALRALLGVAGALLVPSSLSLIAAAWPAPAARAKAMGVWAALSGTGLVAGPVLGGLLTEAFGWRAIFLVNVPVAVVATALSRPAPSTPPRPGRMLPARLFRVRAFPLGLVAGAIVNFGLSGVLFVLSLYFQETRGYPPSATGLTFLPLTIPTAFNPILTGRMVARFGPRIPAVSGFLLMAGGTFVQACSTSAVLSVVALALLGFGVSLAIPALLTAVVAAAPPDLTGVAGGALNAARQAGAVLGVAVLGAVVAGTTTSIALVTASGLLLAGALVVAAIPAAEPQPVR